MKRFLAVLIIALLFVLMAGTAYAAGTANSILETRIIAWDGSKWVRLTKGQFLTPTLNGGTFGGGYGDTGVTLSAAGNIQANGTLTIDGASTLTGNTAVGGTFASTGAATLASLVCTAAGTFGGGYGSTGATIATTGTGQFNGALTTDSTLSMGGVTFTGATTVQNKRLRVTRAQANAGQEVLPAVAGKKYRLIDCSLIAYGGNMEATANATGIAIIGTQTLAANLFEADLAQLTQSAINKPGTASTKILADGASFVACDANTAITVQAVAGADLITATGVDVVISYVLE